MKIFSKYLLFTTIAVLFVLVFPISQPVQAAACLDATSLAAIGNASISTLCTVAANTSAVADLATGQNSLNTAITTITAAVTVTSGTSGTTVLGSGSFSLGTNGSISVGTTQVTVKPNYPVWVVDADVDGWVGTNWTFSTATNSGAPVKQRLGLMKSIGTLDCNDAAYSASNTCYPAFYPAFYPSFAPYGGFSPYGSFYPMFSP